MINIFIKIAFIMIFGFSFLYTQNSDIADTLEIFNDIREKKNLYPLEINDTLNEIADIRAKELSVNFSHIRPNNTKYDELIYENRVIVYSSDENIAYRFKNPQTVVSYWMNSNQYKLNILSDKFTHVGIAHYYSNGEDYWAVIFAQLVR